MPSTRERAPRAREAANDVRWRVLEQHEGERAAGLQVRRAQDQLAEAGLAQVLGGQGDVALAELGLRRRPRPRSSGRARSPTARGEPLAAALDVEQRLEGLGEAAAVAR